MDVMVSSTCSTASIESAPAGFPGFTADNAADVATENTERRLVARERPVSTSETERFSGNSLQLSLPKKFSQFVNNNKTRNAQNKRASPSRLSSIFKRGRYDASYFRSTSAPDYYPFPRWRPLSRRRGSCSGVDVDLKRLDNVFKEFEWKNRRKSVIRFFNGR